jgi:hypothetical protein
MTPRDERKVLEQDMEEVKKAVDPADGAKALSQFIKDHEEPLLDFEGTPWNFNQKICNGCVLL